MMVVQAGAARAVLAGPPAAAGEAGQAARIKEAREAGNAARVKEAGEALLAVEASGRAALAELRNLLGLLSPVEADGSPAEAGGAALHPQPGLSELDALIGRVSAAGLPVQLHVSGTPRPLPPGADLAAYRVVQEALTNVLRHAGRAAASVMVHWGESVVITVSDDGDGAAAATDQAEESGQGTWAGGGGTLGRGLLGLRERLSLYGGELEAGPRPDGGWQLRAVMPAGHPA
jgi:signal transduction histidine kinase